MTEYTIWYEYGTWTVKRMEDGQVYSTHPMPSLEEALRYVANQTGGAVGFKVITKP